MGAKIQAFDIFQTPLSSHYPLPLIWRNCTAVIKFYSKGHKYAQQTCTFKRKKCQQFFSVSGTGILLGEPCKPESSFLSLDMRRNDLFLKIKLASTTFKTSSKYLKETLVFLAANF
jgi:hypothetical protein